MLLLNRFTLPRSKWYPPHPTVIIVGKDGKRSRIMAGTLLFLAHSMRPDDRQAFSTVGIKFALLRSGIFIR